MSDEAKAVEALAKLGERTLDSADRAGSWLGRVFAGGFNQLAGTWEDSMAGFRYRNRIRVLQKTQAAIDAADLQNGVRALSDRLAVPLLEAISDESDDTLQGVWATYIRNAVDPKKPSPDRLLIDVIRKLDPCDWPVLQVIFVPGTAKLTAENFETPEKDLGDILDRLAALGLLDHDDDMSVYLVDDLVPRSMTISVGGDYYYGNKLLRKLQAATS